MDKSIRFVARHYQKGVFEPSKGWQRVIASIPDFRKADTIKRSSFYVRMAVVFLLLIATGVGVWMISNQPQQLVAQSDNTGWTLPDQTALVMQQGARLEYDRHFGKDKRHVSMQGEIAFTVVPDETKPFIVSTPVARIEVLGTEFTVNADDNELHLNVTSGKVLFIPNDPLIPMPCNAGTTIHYSDETETVEVTSPDSNMEINAKEEFLLFDNIRLEEVTWVLSHFYDVSLELPENESDIPFSSSFTRKSIVEIIHIINFTLDTNLEIIEHGERQ